MCIYIYICVYVYVCIYVCTYIYIYICSGRTNTQGRTNKSKLGLPQHSWAYMFFPHSPDSQGRATRRNPAVKEDGSPDRLYIYIYVYIYQGSICSRLHANSITWIQVYYRVQLLARLCSSGALEQWPLVCSIALREAVTRLVAYNRHSFAIFQVRPSQAQLSIQNWITTTYVYPHSAHWSAVHSLVFNRQLRKLGITADVRKMRPTRSHSFKQMQLCSIASSHAL